MGRRRRDNTLNLFAFQDIITGVAGVMLFILLLLVVQLTIRTAVASTETVELPVESEVIPETSDSLQQLELMQAELEQLRQQGANLLRVNNNELTQQIKVARSELDALMNAMAEQKQQAESLQSQMTSESTTQQKTSALERRNSLRRKLEELDEEQAKHEGGKLVAFKAESSGVRELWIVDMRGEQAAIFNVESPSEMTTVQYGRFDPAVLIAQSVRNRLQELTKERNVVILLRPSIAGSGSELLDAFRRRGLRVALELLDEETRVTQPSESSK